MSGAERRTTLDAELAAARGAVAKLESLRVTCAALRENRARTAAALRASVDNVAAKQRDVEAMDKMGLVPMWHAIKGSRSEKLQKENQELDEARARHERLKADLVTLDARIAHFDAEIETLVHAHTEFERLAAERQKCIVECGGTSARVLVDLSRDIDRLRDTLRKPDEVLFQGKLARVTLKEALASLETMGEWTAGDTARPMLGLIIDFDADSEEMVLDGKLQLTRRAVMEFDRCCFELERGTGNKIDLKPCPEFPSPVVDPYNPGEVSYDRVMASRRLSRILNWLNRNMKKVRFERANIVASLRKAEEQHIRLLLQES